MTSWIQELDRRESHRTPTRIPCAVWVDGDPHEGIIEDVSPSAILVRTPARPAPGSEARVTFSTAGGLDLVLRTAAATGRAIPHTLRFLTSPGVVMRVIEPSAEYLRWATDAQGSQK